MRGRERTAGVCSSGSSCFFRHFLLHVFFFFTRVLALHVVLDCYGKSKRRVGNGIFVAVEEKIVTGYDSHRVSANVVGVQWDGEQE